MTDTPTASVRIERTFDAPVELVWSMWTEREHFEAWYGPPGAAVTVVDWHPEVGGRRFVGMRMETPDGPMEMWFVGEFRELDATRRLVYTEAMADADGNAMAPAQMGMPDDHPMETRVIVELMATGDTTAMTMTHEGVPPDSPGATGWSMAIDKLAARLAAS